MIVMFMKSSTSIAGGEGGGGQKEYIVNLMAMKPSTDFCKMQKPCFRESGHREQGQYGHIMKMYKIL